MRLMVPGTQGDKNANQRVIPIPIRYKEQDVYVSGMICNNTLMNAPTLTLTADDNQLRTICKEY